MSARADTLRRAGFDAVPIVIVETWADGEARASAEMLRLAWKVGDDLSESYIAYRPLPV